ELAPGLGLGGGEGGGRGAIERLAGDRPERARRVDHLAEQRLAARDAEQDRRGVEALLGLLPEGDRAIAAAGPELLIAALREPLGLGAGLELRGLGLGRTGEAEQERERGEEGSRHDRSEPQRGKA